MVTTYNPARRRAIWERDGGICGLCGEPVPLEVMHLDHIIPASLGGSTADENLRPTHPRCNHRRGNGRRRVRRTEVTLTFRIPPALHQALVAVAAAEGRSLNRQIERWVEDWLRCQRDGDTPDA